jgi:periplasmic divalent cation tolerance protein
MSGSQALLCITTLPNQAAANKLAESLVAERLAACVSILAPCRSIYHWQGEVNQDDEVPLLIKTTAERYAELERHLKQNHPYELPELIAVEITQGLPAYLDWLTAQTRP